MSQQNNDAPDLDPDTKEDLKVEVENSIENNGKNFYTDMVKAMLVDYVVNDLSVVQLSEKYHVAIDVAKKIYKSYQFQRRKEEYQNKLYDAVLKKVAKSQTGLIAKITEAITIQVNRILMLQAKDPTYMISNNNMKDLLSSLTIFTKEFRDTSTATGNSRIVQINVEMPKHIPIVTENKTVVDITPSEEVILEPIPEPKNETITDVLVENNEAPDLFGGFVE